MTELQQLRVRTRRRVLEVVRIRARDVTADAHALQEGRDQIRKSGEVVGVERQAQLFCDRLDLAASHTQDEKQCIQVRSIL